MMDAHYIGRGETMFSKMIHMLYPNINVMAQVSLKKLISDEDYATLDPVFQKHKFDFVLEFVDALVAVEINYKHGEIPAKKWSNVFLKLLNKYHIKPVTVDDWDCDHFFQLTAKNVHLDSWDDWIDVINSLKKYDIPSPHLSL